MLEIFKEAISLAKNLSFEDKIISLGSLLFASILGVLDPTWLTL